MSDFSRFTRPAGDAGDAPPDERLRRFLSRLWDALVPRTGACVSVQGELVRAQERLASDLHAEGFENYYARSSPRDTMRDNTWGAMMLFLLDTLIANRGNALDADDVAHFVRLREVVEPNWASGVRRLDLLRKESEGELSAAEAAELARIENEDCPDWVRALDRAARCVANFCVANPTLFDHKGRAVEERGVRDLRDVFAPPPAAPVCPRCGGKGWLAPSAAGAFPSACPCKSTGG